MTVVDTTQGADSPLSKALAAGDLSEIEVAFTDHQGHTCGKRVPAHRIAGGAQVAFCSAALAWDYIGDVLDGISLTGPDSGYPDMFLRPDPQLPAAALAPGRRPRDLRRRRPPRRALRRRRAPSCSAPSTASRRSATGRMGVELEMYLLGPDGQPARRRALLLAAEGERDGPGRSAACSASAFCTSRAGTSSTAPPSARSTCARQPMAAGDQAMRFKYAASSPAATASSRPSWPSPSTASRAARCTSTCRCGRTASPPSRRTGTTRTPCTGRRSAASCATSGHRPVRLADRELVQALRGPVVRADQRTWGGDNRTVAVRSLPETPAASRIELRTGAADAQPHWAIAGLLAAVAAGVEGSLDPGEKGQGNLYGVGEELPQTLGDAIRAAQADDRIVELLGRQAVDDLLLLSSKEWRAFTTQVSAWDIERYQGAI